MTRERLVELLQDHFTERLHAPREAGWQQMANFLAEQTGSTLEEAYSQLNDLEAAGILEFVAMTEPDSPAMLEAARYGDMPAEGTTAGYWLIGPQTGHL